MATCLPHETLLLLQLSETGKLLCGYLFSTFKIAYEDFNLVPGISGSKMSAGMVAGMVKSGCRMCTYWIQVTSLLMLQDFIYFLSVVF